MYAQSTLSLAALYVLSEVIKMKRPGRTGHARHCVCPAERPEWNGSSLIGR